MAVIVAAFLWIVFTALSISDYLNFKDTGSKKHLAFAIVEGVMSCVWYVSMVSAWQSSV